MSIERRECTAIFKNRWLAATHMPFVSTLAEVRKAMDNSTRLGCRRAIQFEKDAKPFLLGTRFSSNAFLGYSRLIASTRVAGSLYSQNA